jgi:hypothetical protein
MIIDDSVSFFAVYHHNCIYNMGLTESFKNLWEKNRYKNVMLCQKDEKGGYLLTQSIMEKGGENPYMQSYYYLDKEALKEGYKNLINKIHSTEKTFYLVRSNDNYDMFDTEKIVQQWKREVKDATKET